MYPHAILLAILFLRVGGWFAGSRVTILRAIAAGQQLLLVAAPEIGIEGSKKHAHQFLRSQVSISNMEYINGENCVQSYAPH